MQRLIFSLILGLGLSLTCATAQIGIVFSNDNNVPCDGTTSIDVVVNDFTDIVLMQWSINWDPAVLSYNSIENVTTVLPQFSQAGNIGTPDQGGIINPGQMTVSWSLSSTLPESLPDGTRLFSIVFDGNGVDGDITNLTVTGTPLAIEVIDANFNDIGAVGSGGMTTLDCSGSTECGPNNGNPSCTTGTAGGVVLNGSEEIIKPGESGCVTITTDNWSDVQSAQFNLNWDPSLLTFTGSQNLCPQLSTAQTNGNNTTGVMTFLWFDGTGMNPTNKANGETVVEVCFDAIGGNNTYADVSYTSVEIADSGQNILPTLADCGSVEICCPPPPDPEFTLVANDITVNQNQEGCINISAINFIDIASMQFTISWDETIAQYNDPNIQNIHPNLIPNPLFAFFSPDKVRMTWNSGNGLGTDIADAETLFQICFDGIGPVGSSTPIDFIDVPGVAIEIGDGNGNPKDPVILDAGSLTIAGSSPCTVSTQVIFPLCAGETGSITLTTDAVEPYSCVWTFNGGPAPSITTCEVEAGLPGTYCVTITDANGATCNVCADIINPDPLSFSDSQKNIDCDGLGEICLSDITGGSGSKSVTWSDGPTGLKRTGLTVGTYTMTITDENDCTISETYNISNTLVALTLDGTPEGAGCSGLGKVNLMRMGGCPTYSYTTTQGTVDGEMIIDIPPGDVTVTVTDGNGDMASQTFTISNGVDPLSAMATEINHENCDGDENGSASILITGGCSPYTSSLGTVNGSMIDLNDLAPGEYTIDITDAQGTTTQLTFTIDMGTMLDVTATVTPSSGGNDGCIELMVDGGTEPYMVTVEPGGLLCDIPGGDYTIVVTDANGCSATIMETVGVDGDEPTINDLTVTSEDSFNGFGVSCLGECDGVLTWSVSGGSGATTATLNGVAAMSPAMELCAGSYILEVTDSNGASTSEMFTISSPAAISVDMDVTNTEIGMSTGAIDLTVSGGVGPYTFQWNTGAITEDLTDLAAGTYNVMILDANQCESMELNIDVTTGDAKTCYVTYNNIITPGGSLGMNDVLDIECSMMRDNTLQVYDRWGKEVFVQANYDNTWSGNTIAGSPLSEGTYFWVMDVDFGTERRLYKGFVTILRDSE